MNWQPKTADLKKNKGYLIIVSDTILTFVSPGWQNDLSKNMLGVRKETCFKNLMNRKGSKSEMYRLLMLTLLYDTLKKLPSPLQSKVCRFIGTSNKQTRNPHVIQDATSYNQKF